jgi:phosphomethylpyrimidine synthase
MAKGIHHGEKDLVMANARKKLNWEAQFDSAMCPAEARRIRNERPPADPDTCTMCGSYCAVKIVNEWLDDASTDVFE